MSRARVNFDIRLPCLASPCLVISWLFQCPFTSPIFSLVSSMLCFESQEDHIDSLCLVEPKSARFSSDKHLRVSLPSAGVFNTKSSHLNLLV
jgi:hypothetical protein